MLEERTMRIKEITQPSDEALLERLGKNNTTGVKTEDLMEMVRTHEANEWTIHENYDAFLKHLEELER